MKLKCAICGRERDEGKMTVFSPTEAEKRALIRMGEETPLSRYAYCQPCVRLLSDPTTAIPLLQGTLQMQARSIGVPGHSAEELAKKYAAKVLRITKEKLDEKKSS